MFEARWLARNEIADLEKNISAISLNAFMKLREEF